MSESSNFEFSIRIEKETKGKIRTENSTNNNHHLGAPVLKLEETKEI